jgi:hypothetical protein
MGSNPVDGKHLIISKHDYSLLINKHPEAKQFIRRYMGGDDFINGTERYCLWIDESNLDAAISIPFIGKRLDECRKYRKTAGRDAKKMADKPYRFCYRTHKNTSVIIYPNTSSANRMYLPGGFTDCHTVINKDAFAIYDPPAYALGVLSSTLHRVGDVPIIVEIEEAALLASSL